MRSYWSHQCSGDGLQIEIEACVQAGGASISTSFVGDLREQPAVEVTDRGTGLYELHFTITQVGNHSSA